MALEVYYLLLILQYFEKQIYLNSDEEIQKYFRVMLDYGVRKKKIKDDYIETNMYLVLKEIVVKLGFAKGIVQLQRACSLCSILSANEESEYLYSKCLKDALEQILIKLNGIYYGVVSRQMAFLLNKYFTKKMDSQKVSSKNLLYFVESSKEKKRFFKLFDEQKKDLDLVKLYINIENIKTFMKGIDISSAYSISVDSSTFDLIKAELESNGPGSQIFNEEEIVLINEKGREYTITRRSEVKDMEINLDVLISKTFLKPVNFQKYLIVSNCADILEQILVFLNSLQPKSEEEQLFVTLSLEIINNLLVKAKIMGDTKEEYKQLTFY